jgi:subtilase family serine protease
MIHRSITAAALALGLTWMGAVQAAPALAGEGSSPAVVQNASPAASPSSQVAATPASTPVEFNVSLALRNEAGAQALAQSVTEPGGASYGDYISPSAWERSFSPEASSVQAVSSWLHTQGITVLGVSPSRLQIHASATAATVESAFGTSLGQFDVQGHVLRLASQPLKVPGNVASLIAGIAGVDQTLARPEGLTGADVGSKSSSSSSTLPSAFVVARPCSKYYGQKHDTVDPEFGDGFPEPLPWAVCGYAPTQIQGAYGLSGRIAGGDDGSGVTVAIVDALESPTLFADAHKYSENNQPGELLEASQFSEKVNRPFEVTKICEEEEEWADEQHLDVEAVHTTAPGAHILYVGAKTCTMASLEEAVAEVVEGHLASIVTDSWGNDGGDLLEPESARAGFENVLLMADGTGIGVQFSAGDEGDNFTVVGADIPDYPASSPYSTAVGGTSLEIGKHDERLGEFGWSTGKSVLCTEVLAALEYPGCDEAKLETWLPPAPGAYDYGGGGGTSYSYEEPSYQDAVVPAALAERNSSITGMRNRVVPDISMDGDPSTGFLVGETQQFPKGPRYNEYRLGGTSLSSPLFAGVMADADQAAGKALGFVNPLLYKLDSLPATAEASFYDIVPGGKQAMARNDYLNGVNAHEGVLTSVRVIEYEGRQEFCDGAGSCAKQKNILSTAKGFDSMTGLGSPGAGLIAQLINP